MKKDNLLSSLLGQAALLLMATTALVVTSCSQDNEEPGGTLPEGKITLVPTVAPVTAWSTADDAADKSNASPGTRADATVLATLQPGGEIGVAIGTDASFGNGVISCNYYEVTADGKLSRLPYAARRLETEAPLSVDAPGEYYLTADGTVNLVTDGIAHSAEVSTGTMGIQVTIGTDGKLSFPLRMDSGGLRLSVKASDGTTYTGADITATLKNVTREDGTALDVKTLTSTASAAIWGDISSSSSVTAGDPLLELAVSGGKTYRVLAPRQITFTAARLYTFNVRVGATGITVSSDNLSVGDFEVVETTINAEAEPTPLYNGAIPNLLAIAGQTAYWVAPENVKNTTGSETMTWNEAMADGICPEGWHLPTKDEFVAMTGLSANEIFYITNYDAIVAAFPHSGDDCFYWSTTERASGSAWMLAIRNNDASVNWTNKPYAGRVRCVHAK